MSEATQIPGTKANPFLALPAVARRLGVSVRTVRRLMRGRRFPRAQRLLGRWAIPESDVLALVAEERERGATG